MYEKLSKSYRLDIPLINKINLDNKTNIESIVLNHLSQLNISEERKEELNSIMEFNSEINYVLDDFNETVLNLSRSIEHYTKKTLGLEQEANKALNSSNTQQVKVKNKLISKYTLQINALTNRFKSEVNMAHDYYGEIKELMIGKREILKNKIKDKVLESFLNVPKYLFYIKSWNMRFLA